MPLFLAIYPSAASVSEAIMNITPARRSPILTPSIKPNWVLYVRNTMTTGTKKTLEMLSRFGRFNAEGFSMVPSA